MRRPGLIWLLAAGLALIATNQKALPRAVLAGGQVEPSRQPPVFATQVESVFIDAFVSGSAKRLSADDFILRDGRSRVPFDLVPTESLPIRTVLVFDTSSSMRGEKLDRLRAAAWSFLEQLRPQDEVALVSFSDEIEWVVPLTGDRGRIQYGLLGLRAYGATSAYDALFTALLVPRSALRTLVILFSDGEDNLSWLREDQVRRAVERSNALIHVVSASATEGAGFVQRTPPPLSEHVKRLRRFAEITGGSLIEVTRSEGIEPAFTQILTAMRDRYVLRYTPETEPAPGWHELSLQLRSGKGKVRGRAGYWVEKD